MRINKFVASASSLSRRGADEAISKGRVTVNGQTAEQGTAVTETDVVTLDGRVLTPLVSVTTIMFNKPVGYVCSRDGQGSNTIYDILPAECHQLNPIGRLDKDSSGLLLLTNNGQLAQELSHPKYQKTKVYEVILDHPLPPLSQQIISDHGVTLEDGISKFQVTKLDQQRSMINDQSSRSYEVALTEGRNRQIRRTFSALGFTVTKLHRTHFGQYTLGSLPVGQIKHVK